MFGRQFHGYRDYSFEIPLEEMDSTLWSKHQSDMMHIVYPAIAERVAIENGKLVTRLNKRHRARHFKTGDSVMVLHPDMDKSKIHNKWELRTKPTKLSYTSHHNTTQHIIGLISLAYSI